jgi:5-methylcytosine-specific restriction endonuclease McrA
MTTNTAVRNMADSPKRLTVSDRDDHHFIFERDGGRCCVCGKLGHPSDLEEGDQLAYPPHPDNHPSEQIPICGECFITHTNEQLDEYVREMQEHRRALEEDRGDYEQNQGRAFERDDYTCQLCGNEGIPKAERGLIAYPVRAGDYHFDNLVTICDDCLTETLDNDEDDQTAADRLRIRAARAQEWINTDDERPDDRDGDDVNRKPDGGTEIPISAIVPIEAIDDEDAASESC